MCMCLYLCHVCVYLCGSQRSMSGISSVTLHIISYDSVSHIIQLAWMTELYTWVGFWGTELRTSCLCKKHITSWAIFSDLPIISILLLRGHSLFLRIWCFLCCLDSSYSQSLTKRNSFLQSCYLPFVNSFILTLYIFESVTQ